jgi:pyridoxine 5-phosphate synthase
LTRLSVNINKVATIRNSRGGNVPNLVQFALDCESYGAEGITVHPRPDERHIRYQDVYDLKKSIKTEFNIEGNPLEEKFVDLVLDIVPDQVTLVPDAQNQITSNHGWDTITHQALLKKLVKKFKSKGIRVSIFIDPIPERIEAVVYTGADRIELYTEQFAKDFIENPNQSALSYKKAALQANQLGLGINAGHDLNLENLAFFKKNVVPLDEVSIGHALISDALYFGIENTIQLYKRQLK